VRVGLIPYFSRFMRDPMLSFSYRDAFHARGCVLYFADRRLLSSDPARQGDFGELAVKAHIDNLDRARAIASGMYAKFRTRADPGGQPALGFLRAGRPRPVLEPDPAHIGDAATLFELYATGRHSDETLALEAARLGFVSPVTGRPLTAKGVGELLRNPVYNGWVVRFRGFSDEERVEAPWRRRAVPQPDGTAGLEAGPPVSDELWERVQEVRRRRSSVGAGATGGAGPGTQATTAAAKGVADRAYVPNLVCAACGDALHGHTTAGIRRMYHPRPMCEGWRRASHARASFHADVYEWQIAALLATARP
jgi:Recombinase